jgi:glycosyltransferase involved in cell wall biosynthesis
MKVAWVSTWTRKCGIATYSKGLLPALEKMAVPNGIFINLVSLDEFNNIDSLLAHFKSETYDLVFFQHEYGLFGGKNPPRYWFPKLILEIKKEFPKIKILMTSHTVLPEEYRFPTLGKSLFQKTLRTFANLFLLSWLKSFWFKKTYQSLDGVVVHSQLQLNLPKKFLKNGSIREIAHYVPEADLVSLDYDAPLFRVLIFGFITPEKGQDLAIRASALLDSDILKRFELVCAGGPRTCVDEVYENDCKKLARELNVFDRVKFTGFIESSDLNSYFQSAQLVLAPFRETSGSGSLAQALARGMPVLTSDLPLNMEINKRVPDTLAYFKAGDEHDLARVIMDLVLKRNLLRKMAEQSRLYRSRFSVQKISKEYFSLIQSQLR